MLKCITIIVLIITSNSSAQTDQVEYKFDGYMLGITVRQLDFDNFLIADIPLIEARIPLSTKAVQFKYGGHLMWGLTKFFTEWYYATGILFYPFGEFLGLNTTIRLGSFFFENIAYMGAFGANLDVPFGKNNIVTLEVEYFYRNSRDLFDYVSFPTYKGNGEKAINIDSYGIGISIGFRF